MCGGDQRAADLKSLLTSSFKAHARRRFGARFIWLIQGGVDVRVFRYCALA